jgi:hypothetical protein
VSRYHQITDIYPLLKNPQTYTGERPATMRSGWEIRFVTQYLDINTNVLEGKSEVPVPYICGTDGRQHRYFIDFWMKCKTKDGGTKEILIEIKPHKDTLEPEVPKRKTAGFYKRVKTYIKNQSKWKTVRSLCEGQQIQGRQIEFTIISEKDCPWFVR